MPRKDQLAILFLLRFAEPAVRYSSFVSVSWTGLYLFHMIVTLLMFPNRRISIISSSSWTRHYPLDKLSASPQQYRQPTLSANAFRHSLSVNLPTLREEGVNSFSCSVQVLRVSSHCSPSEISTVLLSTLKCLWLTNPVGSISVLSCSSFGFIKHFYQGVILWGLEGAFNGNVATARTVVTEVVGEKK